MPLIGVLIVIVLISAVVGGLAYWLNGYLMARRHRP
jgi:hypothetical protein